MKLIPLIGKYGIGKFAIVDDEDYEFISKYKWHGAIRRNIIYAYGSIPLPNGKKRVESMSRLIMKLSNSKKISDHKNGNGLDNRKNNLRISTQKQNCQNRTSRTNSSSKYLGVVNQIATSKFIKKDGSIVIYSCNRIYAQICPDKTNIYLGTFKTEEQAALSYNEAAKKYYGDFAKLNKV